MQPVLGAGSDCQSYQSWFWWLVLAGWQVWAADLREGVPGDAEEVRLHLQHPHGEEGAGAEARPDALGQHGGECIPRDWLPAPG